MTTFSCIFIFGTETCYYIYILLIKFVFGIIMALNKDNNDNSSCKIVLTISSVSNMIKVMLGRILSPKYI